jgi:hypothetical protein
LFQSPGKARPSVKQPIVDVEIVAPDADTDDIAGGAIFVDAAAPQSEIDGYAGRRTERYVNQ